MPTKEELERENEELRRQLDAQSSTDRDAEIQALREQLERANREAEEARIATADTQTAEGETEFRVLSTSLDGRWSEGEFVTAEDLRDYDTDRLLSVGAIRKATAEERDDRDLVLEREAAARRTAEEFDRTPAETEADVDAQSTSGNTVV